MYADHFVDQLRILAALDDTAATDRVLAAFRHVPREAFAGPGPWKVRSPLLDVSLPVHETPDADPRWLYHSVLIVLDQQHGINIGDPALWARLLARADIQTGSRILQVGAGVGYYTAILSHLAGPQGHVTAYEIEAGLAARAKSNLADRKNVEVRHGNAATDPDLTGTFDLVVSFAGVTHVPDVWASRLTSNARLLLPLTGDTWWGAMILAHPANDGFDAITLGRCGFYPCEGARDDRRARRVTELFANSDHLKGRRLRMTKAGDVVLSEANATQTEAEPR